MNAKSRLAIFGLVLTVLFGMIGSTASAGEEFNLLNGNNNFDTLNEHGFPFITPWWTLTNKSGDKLDCTGNYAFNGDCSFRFKGSASEKSVLKQIVKGDDLITVNGFADDASVDMHLRYQGTSLSASTKIKGKAVITANGIKYKSIGTLSGSTMIGEFHEWLSISGNTVTIPQDATITKVAVSFVNKSLKGKAFIDAVNVYFSSNAS